MGIPWDPNCSHSHALQLQNPASHPTALKDLMTLQASKLSPNEQCWPVEAVSVSRVGRKSSEVLSSSLRLWESDVTVSSPHTVTMSGRVKLSVQAGGVVPAPRPPRETAGVLGSCISTSLPTASSVTRGSRSRTINDKRLSWNERNTRRSCCSPDLDTGTRLPPISTYIVLPSNTCRQPANVHRLLDCERKLKRITSLAYNYYFQANCSKIHPVESARHVV